MPIIRIMNGRNVIHIIMRPTKGFSEYFVFKPMNTKTTSGKGTQCDKGYGDGFLF